VGTDLVVARIFEGSGRGHLQIGSLNPVEVEGKTSAPTRRLFENETGTIRACSFKFVQFFDAATETRWANQLSRVVERRKRFFLCGASRVLELQVSKTKLPDEATWEISGQRRVILRFPGVF
jgi:hypothetical protein